MRESCRNASLTRKIITAADVSCGKVELIQLPDWKKKKEKKNPPKHQGLSCMAAVAEERRASARQGSKAR